jgi:hypothetical protein
MWKTLSMGRSGGMAGVGSWPALLPVDDTVVPGLAMLTMQAQRRRKSGGGSALGLAAVVGG